MDSELDHRIHTTIHHCIQQASQYFDVQFQTPSVSYQLRGKAAGKALLLDNQIRLNPILLKENQQAYFDDVIPHEIAHLIAFQRYGRVKPHGKEWRNIMQSVFQRPALATHNLDIRSVQGKTFQYDCSCSSYPLSVRRHNKVTRKQASYFCKKCTKPLKYTGKQLS
ncbi:SprT family zinc-dependent metalloprotease [Vibrio sp. S4M6]|uniref:SprT family zinc-dependent metalloprotease n=1 Tax=Vibrio sinus TaxID=2946865 RepID=UPI00202A82FC|nr:SprT family zinc-dependent metalloprotease [Vibrio sinus]MCL9780905.1 SprT family zinc-dependent metalloprotease [Vibrio sinus]